MCSHTLAAAETAGSLKQFLQWFKGRKRTANLSAISNLNMPKNSGQKVGTRRRKSVSNKPPSEGRAPSCSRVLQPSTGAESNVSANQPNVVPGQTAAWQYDPSFLSVNPPAVKPNQTVTHALVSFVGQGHGALENMQPYYPQRPKPPAGIFAFAKLQFLDNRVSKCYGCGQPLKPKDLVTQAPEEGRQHVSPDVSSVYCHVSMYYVTTAFPGFQPSLCQVPADLLPFLLPEHKEMIASRLGLPV